MKRHFPVIQKAIRQNGYRSLLEIGVASGRTTKRLLKLVRRVDGHLTSIDPVCRFEPSARLAKRWTPLEQRSLDVLPSLGEFDCVLVDGDHNYYTVAQELALIEKRLAPNGMVFLHDVAAPWARRDMYFDLDSIPEAHPTYQDSKRGYWVAKHEGGERNGVLTAVEDFCRAHPSWRLELVEAHHGLATLRPPALPLPAE